MFQRLLLCALLGLALPAAAGLSFRNLDDQAHISGPKLTPKDFAGKVVAVEEFGFQCPPCRASLPHMAKLAKSLAGKPVVFLGSHVQGRADAAVRKLLQDAKCEYPVYQWFSVEGAPRSIGIPHAYVYDARGKVVWNGNPYSDYADFEKAILSAAKSAGKPLSGSLVEGMELTTCKDVVRRLIPGQNFEPTLKLLQSRVDRGGPAAAEAKAILERCEAWAAETQAAIAEAIEERPSEALLLGKLYTRSLPSRSAELRERLSALSKDPLTQRLAASRQTLDKFWQTPAKTPNAKKALLGKVNMQLKQLGLQSPEQETPDARDVKSRWEAFAKELAN